MQSQSRPQMERQRRKMVFFPSVGPKAFEMAKGAGLLRVLSKEKLRQ